MSPDGGSGVPWVVGALAASLVGHAATYAAMPYGSAASHPAHPLQAEQLEIYVEVPPVDEPSTDSSAGEARRAIVRERRDREPPRELASRELVSTPADPREVPVVETAVVPAVRPRVVVLDPTRAARSVLTLDGPRMPRAADISQPDVESPEQRDARLEGELDGVLRGAATARPEGFGRRTLPTPVRRPDGTLAYPLGQVVAIVNPDGSFTFDDTAGVQFGGMGNTEREGMQTHWGLEEFMMRRRGNDPYASTRRWFAEQTEATRSELERAYIDRQAHAASRGMRGRLSRLIADETRPIDARRRAIFEEWDGCAEHEIVGDAVRAAIVAFVRERMPRESPDAYPDAELDELNRGRSSSAEFRPYGP